MGRMLAIAAGVMLLGACSGDDDGGDGSGDRRTQACVDAVSASILEDDETGLGVEQADCMATAAIDAVGVEILIEAGISPEELRGVDSLSALDVDVADRLGVALRECDITDRIKDLTVDGFMSSRDGGAL